MTTSLVVILGDLCGTSIAGGEPEDDSAHAGNFTPQAVVEGGGDTQDDPSDGCVIERVGADVDCHLDLEIL